MTRRTSRASEIAVELEGEVLRSGATPGTHIGLRKDLLERFGASPSVVNEALRILRDRGLITVKPGAHGGIFVSDNAQWIQLSGINMWFRRSPLAPLHLYEARIHLEDTLTRVALPRRQPDDLRAIDHAMASLRASTGHARAYWTANTRLHLAIGRAANLPLLHEMYQALVVTLTSGLMHAEFVPDHEKLLAHNLAVHQELVTALHDRAETALEEILDLHRHDLVRAENDSWSPQHRPPSGIQPRQTPGPETIGPGPATTGNTIR